jgi:pimeloyl-ACP methyl ester carboxylesterase
MMPRALMSQADAGAPGFYVLPFDGSPLHVARLPAEGRPGHPRALFISGCFANIRVNARWVAALMTLFDVILCELPGHGDSAPVQEVSLDSFAAVYARLIDHHIPSCWPLTVIGESLGGLVALRLARLRADRVARLVLLDPPLVLTRPPVRALLGRVWRSGGSPYQRRILQTIFGFDPATEALHVERPMYDLLHGLTVPTMLLAGSEAHRHRPPGGLPPSLLTDDDLAASQGANPRVNIPPRIDRAGHCALLESPGACVATVRRWMVEEPGMAIDPVITGMPRILT